MNEKKPLTEGYVRDMQKGFNKTLQSGNQKPIKPPPAPKPANSPSNSGSTNAKKSN